MAPCKPAKAIKIRVTRHNAQRLGPSLTSTVRIVATRQKTLVQLPPPVADQPGVTGASLENASEWNSLLLSARAQRGPFWDVSTQQFLVEEESEIYYDPTPLLEATRSLTANKDSQGQSSSSNPNAAQSSSAQQQQQQQRQQQQQLHAQQAQRQAAFAASQQQFGGFMGTPGGTPVMHGHGHGHATPTRSGMPFGGTPGSGAGTPGGQFYGDIGTPTRPGGMMNGAPVSAAGTPDLYGRRITRGMSDGFPAFAG